MPPPEATLDALFDECAKLSADAYQSLGHTLGWRWLTGPRATLSPACQIGLVTLNPGGGEESAHQSGASYEDGSSYVTESWLGQPAGQAPLQRQVQALFRELMAHRGEGGDVSSYLATRALTGHFVPFRSPSLASLANKQASLEFARGLWGRVLGQWRPRLIITMDREAYSGLAGVVMQVGGRRIDARAFATGWGSYTCEAMRFDGYRDGETMTLARLPHLSRFSLFSEPGYSTTRRAALRSFFEWVAQPR